MQDWQSYSIDPYSCYMCDHTYMLINALVHVTVLLSDLNTPSALQNRLYSKFTILKNHVVTALDVVLKELQIFQQENLLYLEH